MHVFYLVPTRQHRHQIHFGEHVRGLIDPWMDSPIPASEIRPGMAMTSAARADKTAAIRCIRLARNAANEGVTAGGGARARLFALAATELQKARWQACSAIACGGV